MTLSTDVPKFTISISEIDRSDTESLQVGSKYCDRDIIPMWVADSDFAVACPKFRQAMKRRASSTRHSVIRSVPTAADRSDRRAPARAPLRLEGFKPAWVVPVPNVHRRCFVPRLPRAPVDPERCSVDSSRASYIGPFSGWRRSYYDMSTVEMPMTFTDAAPSVIDHRPGLARAQPAAIRGACYFLCNPQNPGGTVLPARSELRAA